MTIATTAGNNGMLNGKPVFKQKVEGGVRRQQSTCTRKKNASLILQHIYIAPL